MTEQTTTPTVTGAWVTGSNRPGYLPECDTYASDTWEDAWMTLVDEAQRWADQDDEALEDLMIDMEVDPMDEEEPSTRAAVDAMTSAQLYVENGIHPDRDHSFYVVDNHGHAMAWWIMWDAEREPFTDDVGTPLD
jgi:hypothetical protein